MDVRYTLAVVTGAGGGLGREVAVALARLGAAVVVADRDLAAAERTLATVLESRVRGWAVAVDLAEEADVRLLAARAADLGGADILVTDDLLSPALLTGLFLDGLAERRGRRQVGAVVTVGSSADLVRFTTGLADPDTAARARVTAVVTAPAVPPADVVRAVVDLVRRGRSGQVVDLLGEPAASAEPSDCR